MSFEGNVRREIDSLSIKDDAGKELAVLGRDKIVSVQLPLQPALVNSSFHPVLDGKVWRHEMTPWYNGELAMLKKLRRYDSYVADSLKVLLYGIFAKMAEQMGRRGLWEKSAYPKFCRLFKEFGGRYGSMPMRPGFDLCPVEVSSPADYLEHIDVNSYMLWRLTLLG